MTKKRIILLITGALTLVLGTWFLTKTRTPEDQLPKDLAESAPPLLNRHKEKMEKTREDQGRGEPRNEESSKDVVTEAEAQQIEEQYEKVEKQWKEAMEELFFREFGVDEVAFEQYLTLRDAYEEELYYAEKEFHEYMVKKYGEDYAYNPTATKEAFENRVITKYEEQLEKLLGEENFSRYLEVRESFNAEILEDGEIEEGVVTIEL